MRTIMSVEQTRVARATSTTPAVHLRPLGEGSRVGRWQVHVAQNHLAAAPGMAVSAVFDPVKAGKLPAAPRAPFGKRIGEHVGVNALFVERVVEQLAQLHVRPDGRRCHPVSGERKPARGGLFGAEVCMTHLAFALASCVPSATASHAAANENRGLACTCRITSSIRSVRSCSSAGERAPRGPGTVG